MSRITFIISILLPVAIFAQPYPAAVVEYRPAPGQYINTQYWGCDEAAQSLTGEDGHISLGAFGGSVTVQFSPAVQNDAANPFGVDFVIMGNPQPYWCEGGAVQVMCDRNGNGLPDDTWCQLASSQHFFKSSKKSTYTYTNPFSANFLVEWKDANGATGSVANVSQRGNEFYPMQDLFPQIAADGARYSGWEYQPKLVMNGGSVRSYNPAFGMADNQLVNRDAPLTMPDNPYTDEVEGCGGDSFDINWAVDDAGNYVQLDSVNFIRIYNAYQAMGGWLGELSPEITRIFALAPVTDASPAGNKLVLDWLPDAVATGTKLSLDAAYFKAGRYERSHQFVVKVSDQSVLTVSEDFTITALAQGTARITVRSAEHAGDSAFVEIHVQTPSYIKLSELPQIFTNDTVLLTAEVRDVADQMQGFLPVTFSADDAAVHIFNDASGRTFFTAQQAGQYAIRAQAGGLTKDFTIEILKSDISPRVSVSFYDGAEQIIAAQKYSFRSFSLSEYVSGEYSSTAVLSAAHALAFPFGNVSFTSDLRFSASSAGIRLKSVPVISGSSAKYFAASASKQWAVIAGKRCYLSGLDSITLHENEDITAVLTGATTSFTTLNITGETEHELQVTLAQNTLTVNGNTCAVVQSPICGMSVQGKGAEAITDLSGIAYFAKSADDNQTFSYGQVRSSNYLQTGVAEIGTKNYSPTLDWSQFQSVQVFALDGRKIFETLTPSDALPLRAFLPRCYVLQGQLRSGNRIIEQICN